MGIASVVDEDGGKSSGLHDAMCSACEMTVVWMQNQLRQNQTRERIMSYVNEVYHIIYLLLYVTFRNVLCHKMEEKQR